MGTQKYNFFIKMPKAPKLQNNSPRRSSPQEVRPIHFNLHSLNRCDASLLYQYRTLILFIVPVYNKQEQNTQNSHKHKLVLKINKDLAAAIPL